MYPFRDFKAQKEVHRQEIKKGEGGRALPSRLKTMSDFYHTCRGERFYDVDIPSIKNSLSRIADAMERKITKENTMIIEVRNDMVVVSDGKDAVDYSTLPDGYSQYLPNPDKAKFLWKDEDMAINQCEADIRTDIERRFPDASDIAINRAVSVIMGILANKIREGWNREQVQH